MVAAFPPATFSCLPDCTFRSIPWRETPVARISRPVEPVAFPDACEKVTVYVDRPADPPSRTHNSQKSALVLNRARSTFVQVPFCESVTVQSLAVFPSSSTRRKTCSSIAVGVYVPDVYVAASVAEAH